MIRLPEWIAHPEEWEVFALVAAIALILLYLLFRLAFGGGRGGAAGALLPAKAFRRVLLPVLDGGGWAPAAVQLACRLAGEGGSAAVLLFYVIEVPRALALDTPLPDEEAEAARAMAEASEIVRRCGLQPQAQVRKARAAAEETLRAASEEKADLLVLMTPDPLLARSEELARRAPCEVVLARVAAEE